MTVVNHLRPLFCRCFLTYVLTTSSKYGDEILAQELNLIRIVVWLFDRTLTMQSGYNKRRISYSIVYIVQSILAINTILNIKGEIKYHGFLGKVFQSEKKFFLREQFWNLFLS